MNLWKISLRNIRSKPLVTLLSVLVLTLSIGLLLGIQQIKTSFEYQINNNLGDIDLVIGAKGSPLQLVLSSVLHLDNPTGNIAYNDIANLMRNPMVKTAVPISYGDNYKGYRIVGTTPEFFTLYDAELSKGQVVNESLEVVLGHIVAQQQQLEIGDTFLSSHGLIDNDIEVHTDELKIVGILKPTQKVIDRLILTNLQSVWDVHDHDHHDENGEDSNGGHVHEEHEHENGNQHEHDKNDNNHHHEEHDDHHGEHIPDSETTFDDKEITALLVSFRNPAALLTLPRRINENTNMQAALPKFELDRLYQFTGVGLNTITWIAYLILILSGMTIFVSLYKMVRERTFDLALMRTYGASNFQLVRIIAYEGFMIVCLAFVLGFGISKFGIDLLFAYLENGQQQLMLQSLTINQVLQIFGIVMGIVLLAVIFAIYPILRMNISNILSREI